MELIDSIDNRYINLNLIDNTIFLIHKIFDKYILNHFRVFIASRTTPHYIVFNMLYVVILYLNMHIFISKFISIN